MLFIGILGGDNEWRLLEMLLKLLRLRNGRPAWRDFTVNRIGASGYIDKAKAAGCDSFVAIVDAASLRLLKRRGILMDILLLLEAGEDINYSDFMSFKSVIIANCDDKNIFPFSLNIKTSLVTCGLNPRSGVTVSSVSEDYYNEKILCCIQKSIQTLSGNIIVPQEFPVKLEGGNNDISKALAAIAAAIIDDVEFSELDGNLL